MAKHHILSVNFDFPGGAVAGEVKCVPFSSDQSLLDSDIIIFQPGFGTYHSLHDHHGFPSYEHVQAVQIKQHLAHWQKEIAAAIEAEKIIFIILTKPEIVQLRRETLYIDYDKTSSYASLPIPLELEGRTGQQITPTKDIGFFGRYWNEFSSVSHYDATLNGEFCTVLLTTRDSDKIVAAVDYNGEGAVIYLPKLDAYPVTFTRHDGRTGKDYWTEEAKTFGKKLIGSLVAVVKALRSEGEKTPPPDWAADEAYLMPEEPVLQGKIQEAAAELERIQADKARLEGELDAAGGLRRLLYEQGKPLEYAILDALRLFGFEAEPFVDAKSEFDAVFVSPEGRFLGEAEGKDRSAVNIDKYRQLVQNIVEDFAREEVTERAKGILFGNAFRLAPLAERTDAFTPKCLASAEHDKVALVRTQDLFAPARYLKANPDEDYAKQCRQAFITGAGGIVEFPAPPAEPLP